MIVDTLDKDEIKKRRRSILLTAWIVAAIAVSVFFGFIWSVAS